MPPRWGWSRNVFSARGTINMAVLPDLEGRDVMDVKDGLGRMGRNFGSEDLRSQRGHRGHPRFAVSVARAERDCGGLESGLRFSIPPRNPGSFNPLRGSREQALFPASPPFLGFNS